MTFTIFRPFDMTLKIQLRCLPSLLITCLCKVSKLTVHIRASLLITCLYKVSKLTVHIRAKTKPRGQKKPPAALRDRVVFKTQIQGKARKDILLYGRKVSKSTVASITLQWKKLCNNHTVRNKCEICVVYYCITALLCIT